MALNPQNLIKNEDLTPEERRRNTSKAGKASVEARRNKRNMQEVFKAILDMPLKEGTVEEVQTFAGAKGKNLTVSEAIAFTIANKALKGDLRAAEFVRDTAGMKPTQAVEVKATSEHYEEFMKALDDARG